MLELRHIKKSYKEIHALQDIHITFNNGIYALLGPNGAGKSTLMKIICCQIKPDQGEVVWNDTPLSKLGVAYFQDVGYAPQQQGLYDEFSGRRFLTYMALLKGIHKKQIVDEVNRVAQAVNMESSLDRMCKTYSGGMKQRILVAQALLGSPKLLLFDEPTAGLDPKERVSLRHVFERLAKDHILIIATHVVSDIETIAKEVIFLKHGRMIAKGSIPHLLATNPYATHLEDIYLQEFSEEDISC